MGRWILSYTLCGMVNTRRFVTLDEMFYFIEARELPRFKAKRV